MVFQKAMEIAFKYEKMDPLWKKGVLSDQEKTEIIQYEIHACINHVYHVFRTNPESLHPQLLSLYAKRFILSGISFGGRTAVMQAELYPNTFDGYISFEGALSNKMRSSSDFPQFRRGESLPHLDPANESRRNIMRLYFVPIFMPKN